MDFWLIPICLIGAVAGALAEYLISRALARRKSTRERLSENDQAVRCRHGVKRWKSCQECAREFGEPESPKVDTLAPVMREAFAFKCNERALLPDGREVILVSQFEHGGGRAWEFVHAPHIENKCGPTWELEKNLRRVDDVPVEWAPAKKAHDIAKLRSEQLNQLTACISRLCDKNGELLYDSRECVKRAEELMNPLLILFRAGDFGGPPKGAKPGWQVLASDLNSARVPWNDLWGQKPVSEKDIFREWPLYAAPTSICAECLRRQQPYQQWPNNRCPHAPKYRRCGTCKFTQLDEIPWFHNEHGGNWEILP